MGGPTAKGLNSQNISIAKPIFDISIRCGDIRDEIIKLSKIAPNFALPDLRGCGPQKVVAKFSCLLCGTSRGKFSRNYTSWPQSYNG